jgi:hypothetical protein
VAIPTRKDRQGVSSRRGWEKPIECEIPTGGGGRETHRVAPQIIRRAAEKEIAAKRDGFGLPRLKGALSYVYIQEQHSPPLWWNLF